MTSLFTIPLNVATTCCTTCSAYCACKAITLSCELNVTLSRFMYLGLVFFGTILALFLQQFGQPVTMHIDYYGIQYNHDICPYQCMGNEAVYRISICLTVFFTFMALCTSTISQCSTSIQQKYWILKLLLLSIALFTSPLIPDGFITVWYGLCKYASTLFLLIQMCILIDFGYTFNDKLISYDGLFWKSCIIIMSFGLYVATFLVCMMYTNISYSILIIFGNVLVTLLSISPLAPHGTLLTSSIVSFQVAYNYLIGHQAATHVNTLLGSFITSISLTFTAYSTSKTNIFHYDKIQETNELVLLDSKIILDEENQVVLPDKSPVRIVSAFYHLTLALCSMYMPILLVGFDQTSTVHIEIIISQITGLLLYTWTLIAPSIFPDREFHS